MWTKTPGFRTGGVGVSKFAAEAKYSSEKDSIEAPSTVVVMFVEVENVVSIKAAGTGVTVTLEVVVLEGTASTTVAARI